MSYDNAIIAKTEAVGRIIKNFSEDLQSFTVCIDRNSRDINQAVDNLSGCWQGDLYEQFCNEMRSNYSEIRNSVMRAEKLKEKLDEISEKFDRALQSFAQAGETNV